MNKCGKTMTTRGYVYQVDTTNLYTNKSSPRTSYYHGKFKTPELLLPRANSRCRDEEMNTSYMRMCFAKYRDMIRNKEYENVIESLANFITLEPAVEIRSECVPPPIAPVDCSKYKHTFGNGVRKVTKEPRIGILIQLGFDVEMLEVYLNEVYDVIDKFFITESVVTHSNRQTRKPLMWERVKEQPRFKKFRDKVVHFIVDDAGRNRPTGDIWVSEFTQERLRWEKFLEWNNKAKFFGEDDIIGFGDTDEIPSRNSIAVLRQCTGSFTSIDIGSMFLFGDDDAPFISDFPIRGHRFHYGDPTFFSLQSAKKYAQTKHKYPSRQRGRSPSYIIGGTHISPYSYMPFILNKQLVATERTPADFPLMGIEEMEEYFARLEPDRYRSRIRSFKNVRKEIGKDRKSVV